MPKHRFLYIIWTVCAMMILSSCHRKDEPKPDIGPKEATRTVLVYMVADNNLGGIFDSSDLKEMLDAAAAGDLGGGRLLVYHSSSKGVVLKEVTPSGIDTLKVYDKLAPSVSIARMRQVVNDTKTLAPAKDYGLVLWSHATGWLQDGISETRGTMLYSFGQEGTSSWKMNITSLSEAIRDAGFSFIYFDCCYMGSIEVLYQMRDCADYFVVSPTEDPADGMPYDKNMKNFFNTYLTVEEAMVNAAKTTFDTYNDVFKIGNCPCTMTVVRAKGIDAIADATRRLYRAAEMSYKPMYSYQKYTTGTCYYYDFEDYIQSICTDSTLYEAWRAAMDNAIAYTDATPYIWSSIPITRYSGLSTYILFTSDNINDKGYKTLSWYSDVASSLKTD